MANGGEYDLPIDYVTGRIEDITQQAQQAQQVASVQATGSSDGQIAIFIVASQSYVPGTIFSGDGIGLAYTTTPSVGLQFSINDASALRTELSIDAIATRKSNLSASAAPTTGDDSDDGYGIGSLWIDTTADDAYIALDVTVGAAVWKKITP